MVAACRPWARGSKENQVVDFYHLIRVAYQERTPRSNLIPTMPVVIGTSADPLRPSRGRREKDSERVSLTPERPPFGTFVHCTSQTGRREEKPLKQAVCRVFWGVYRIGDFAFQDRRLRPLGHPSETS